MSTISAAVLIALLTLMRWDSDAAQQQIALTSAYTNYSLPATAGNYYDQSDRIEFGPGFTGVTVDHEFQHAFYDVLFEHDTERQRKEILVDFKAADVVPCVAAMIYNPVRVDDVYHLPHFVVNCIGRNKNKLTMWGLPGRMLANKYFSWLQGHSVFIPIGELRGR